MAEYRARSRWGGYAGLIVGSIDAKTMLDLIAQNRLPEVTAYLAAEIERLVSAGADFGLLAANTPHLVLMRSSDNH